MELNRNIVVKKEGDKLLLPTIERKELPLPSNTIGREYIMCKAIDYDPNSETINLKLYSDVVDAYSFKVSVEVNSEFLSSLSIKKITFIPRPSRFPTSRWSPQGGAAIKGFTTHPEKIVKNQLADSKNFGEKPNIPQTASISLQLRVKDLKFCDGKVSFEYYVSHVGRKVTFDINHPFLKKEHDSIKNYFPKVLNVDKFSISIQFEYLEREILSYNPIATEIVKIDESLFELVEDLYIQDYIINGSEDEIVSIDELAVDAGKKIGSDKIQDTQWLLSRIITKARTKHYYHLRYLSDKHQSDLFNLKLTGKPLSFIFLLPVQNGHCLIWETYSTEEATYVWKLSSQINSQLETNFQELVDCIKWLRGNNKTDYLRTKPENFIRIKHDYSADDFGFKKWKSVLDGILFNGIITKIKPA